jgi:hypothetical protein
MRVLNKAASDGFELRSLLVVKPERGGESSSRIAMHDRTKAPLDVAHGAGADARTIRELFLGHPGRCSELLEKNAQRLIGHRSHHPSPPSVWLISGS